MSVVAEIMDEKVKRKLEFSFDKSGKIAPQSARDEEILIDVWNINVIF